MVVLRIYVKYKREMNLSLYLFSSFILFKLVIVFGFRKQFFFKKEILMIPEITHEALINGGIGHIGSANADLKTTHTETFGASLDNENNCVTCFVLSILAEPILENLKEKGRISFFFGLPSHEAYQFKGQFLETREITEEELANSEKILSVTKDMFDSIGIPSEAVERMLGTPPDLGVTFRVEKIFIQTPGPEAGQEIPFS